MPSTFVYVFTPKEFFYFLFRKKTCPKCGGPLRKEKYFRVVSGKECGVKMRNLHVSKKWVKKYEYRYICQECAALFSLQELAGETPAQP